MAFDNGKLQALRAKYSEGHGGELFDAAFRKFAAAFEKRADEVYGRDPA